MTPMAMNCLQSRSLFLPLLFHPKHKQQSAAAHSFLPPIKSRNPARHSHQMPTRAMAIANPLILGVTSPGGGDIRVLIPTAGVLLFAYVLANFLVPAFLSKQFEINKDSEANGDNYSDDGEDDADDDDDNADGIPMSQNAYSQSGRPFAS